jgi:hypothetical protein
MTKSLEMYVVYGPPRTKNSTPSGGFPVVVMKLLVSNEGIHETSCGWRFKSLDSARSFLKERGHHVVAPRDDTDDPAILETWA